MNELTIKSRQFSAQSTPMSLSAIAQAIGAECVRVRPDQMIDNVGTIQSALANQITFLNNNDQYHKYRQHLLHTQASALITTKEIAEQEQNCALPVIVHPAPRHAIVQVIHLLFPKLTFTPLQHPTVVVGDRCDIHPKSYIGPNVVIGDDVRIGENVVIQANSFVGDYCRIGKDTYLAPNTTLYHGTQVGEQCTIHSGVVLGSDGFGFERQGSGWVKVPQIGNVIVGNRVEIGANTTIDRGAIDNTVIGDDVILDNLIQIGHNVKIGNGTAIAACVGIAGSSEIGSNCLIGGASNINGHIKITDRVSIVGCSNVAKPISASGIYASAITVTDMKTWKKNLLRFHQLDKLANRITELESRLESQLESQKGA